MKRRCGTACSVFFAIAKKVDIITCLWGTIITKPAAPLAVSNNALHLIVFLGDKPMEQKKTRAKGAGRKPLSPENRAKSTSIRLTEAQHKKFIELGGVAWLRQQIDNAIKAG